MKVIAIGATDRPRHPARVGQRRVLEVLQHRGDIATILPQLGVLVACAAVLITVAILQMRRALTA